MFIFESLTLRFKLVQLYIKNKSSFQGMYKNTRWTCFGFKHLTKISFLFIFIPFVVQTSGFVFCLPLEQRRLNWQTWADVILVLEIHSRFEHKQSLSDWKCFISQGLFSSVPGKLSLFGIQQRNAELKGKVREKATLLAMQIRGINAEMFWLCSVGEVSQPLRLWVNEAKVKSRQHTVGLYALAHMK